MIWGFFILVSCLLLGEVIVTLTGISIPGAVLGMVILFIGFLIKGEIPESVDKVGSGLIQHIGLLFVPAGAGISMFLGLIVQEWDVILIASVTSTIATLIACAALFTLLQKREEAND